MRPMQDEGRRTRDRERTLSNRDRRHGGATREAHWGFLTSIFGAAIAPGTQPSSSRSHRQHRDDKSDHHQQHPGHHKESAKVRFDIGKSKHVKPGHSKPSDPEIKPAKKETTSRPEERRSTNHTTRSAPKTKSGTKHNRREDPPPPPKRIKLTLKPLHPDSPSWVLNVPSSHVAGKIKLQIRQLHRERGMRLPSKVDIALYDSQAQILNSDTKLPSSATLWYRAIDVKDARVDKWKFSSPERIDKQLASEMSRAIESGATVGELRRKVAGKWGIEDVNRIRIYAEDGMRRGGLQGNEWIVKEIGKSWLCRWLSLDVRGEGRYAVLKGMRRKEGYVFHPTSRMLEEVGRKGWRVKWLKVFMEKECFLNVGRFEKSKGERGLRKRMKLRLDGNSVADDEKIKWGRTYEFELTVKDAEVLNEDEAWLLSAKGGESCVVCGDEKKFSDFPVSITEACKHDMTICKDCLSKWLESSAEAGNWRRLKCPDPDCAEVLNYDSVKRYASAETFSRYDRWILNDVLEGFQGFERCLSSTCGYGHIHDPTCEVFKCRNPKCGARHCIKHHVFHEDETCKEYDQRQERRADDNRKSERFVREMAKECPKCKRMVHKTHGCNHMTCTCRHEWCYICFAPYITAVTTGILLCHHNPGCTEAPQPFAHLFDREGNLLDPETQELRNVLVPPAGPVPFINRRRPIMLTRPRRLTGTPPPAVPDAPQAPQRFVPQPFLIRTTLAIRRDPAQRRGLVE